MPDGTSQVAISLYDAGKWVFVFVLGVLGFNTRKLVNKVDDHDKNHVSREELRDAIEPMQQQLNDIHNHLMNRD